MTFRYRPETMDHSRDAQAGSAADHLPDGMPPLCPAAGYLLSSGLEACDRRLELSHKRGRTITE